MPKPSKPPGPRSGVLIVIDGDDNDGARRAREVAAGSGLGVGCVKVEKFDGLGCAGESSGAGGGCVGAAAANPARSAPSAAGRRAMRRCGAEQPEVIDISDDEEIQAEVKEEDDFGVDWDDVLLKSEGESSCASGKVGSRRSSRNVDDEEEEAEAEEGEEVQMEEEEEVGLVASGEEQDSEQEGEENENGYGDSGDGYASEDGEMELQEEDGSDDNFEGGDEPDDESEEPDEVGEPSDAMADGNSIAGSSDQEGMEIFSTRCFEGLRIAKKADTTTAGGGIAARTRARRRCSDTNLLKRGTCSKPYCVDTPSEEEEEIPPPPVQPGLPREDCEEENSSGGDHRAAETRRRRRVQIAVSDDDSDEDRGSGDLRTTAPKRQRKEQSAHSEDELEEDGTLGPNCSRPKTVAPSRKTVKEGCKNYDASNQRYVKNSISNAGNPTDRFDQQSDVSFKKKSMFAVRRGQRRAREKFDDLISSIFDGLENYQNSSVPAQEQSGNELPLLISFGDEDQVEEKSEQMKFEDQLWAEFDFALEAYNICDKGGKSNEKEILVSEATSCNRGKHDLIIDEQIGVRCKHCNYVDLEIRYVMPSMVNFSTEREPTKEREVDCLLFDDILTSMGYEGVSSLGDHKTGLVWDLIPGVRESMFPHQQEGFEFMWKKLAGGIDIEQLKHAVDTDTNSGCVISHAPGTGKTRLTITFVQSYLELFPMCRPVIIAPRGMLTTWEHEFKKWNVKLPFHVLNSSDILWREDKTIQKLVAQDESLGEKLSGNKLDKKSRRMVKLASWVEGSSIIGLSYTFFRKLAKDEGMDGHTVKNLLLERPNLLVLDEGHTPRNKKSHIWKVLAEVRTEKRIILSGTLFQNTLQELYNTLCLVTPKFARDSASTNLNKKHIASKRSRQSRETTHFNRKQDILLEKDEGEAMWTSLRLNKITNENVSAIQEYLEPFMHIHNGDILEKSLKGLRVSVVILKPLPHQQEIITLMEENAGKGKKGSFDAEYKISLASVHPYLVTSAKLSDEEASAVSKLKESSQLDPCEGVKTRFVLEIVRLCEPLKERVIVFSQYREPLALIMLQLTSKYNWTDGTEILLMNGDVSTKNRQALMVAFNDMNSEAKVMLASTKACCEGITLIGASRVILLDVVWNPSVARQAIGRAYRIGQKKIVHAYNLIAQGTKDKGKYKKQGEKDHMSKRILKSEPQPAGCSNLPPKLMSDDRVLEAMRENKELGDMFVDIYPSH